MSRLYLTKEQNTCSRLAGKLMQEGEMIQPHVRIGVALSGGMDSWVLLQTLLIRRRILPFPIELMPLHINPGFDPENHLPLIKWLKKAGLPGHIEVTDHGPKAHSDENRNDSPCFYCAMHRRKKLFELCQQYKLSHLAFGHIADDLTSSFLMNVFHSGRVQGMAMKEVFFEGKLTVIRPLMLVDKKLIRRVVNQWDLPVWQNPCPSSEKTNRHKIMEELEIFCKNHPNRRNNIFNALGRWQLEKTQRGEMEKGS